MGCFFIANQHRLKDPIKLAILSILTILKLKLLKRHTEIEPQFRVIAMAILKRNIKKHIRSGQYDEAKQLILTTIAHKKHANIELEIDFFIDETKKSSKKYSEGANDFLKFLYQLSGKAFDDLESPPAVANCDNIHSISSKKLIFWFGLIILAIFLTYSNHFNNEFHYDDFNVIVQNPYIQSPTNIPAILNMEFINSPDVYDSCLVFKNRTKVLSLTRAGK